LILDPAHDGPWNMAADEWLLYSTAEAGRGCLRLYRWQSATLSLGYFQTWDECLTHPAASCGNVVRRLSGGGAILHHREWTYGLALPLDHPLAWDRLGLYRAIHQTLVDWLISLGFSARIIVIQGSRQVGAACGTLEPAARVGTCQKSDTLDAREPDSRSGSPAQATGKCPFLCFLRRSPGDILVQSRDGTIETKIVGSAQRRGRGAVLQHGSILFAQSPYTPELPGLRELSQGSRIGGQASGLPVPPERQSAIASGETDPASPDAVNDWECQFPRQWLPFLEQQLACRWEDRGWSAGELAEIAQIEPKYADPRWNRHRRQDIL